MGRFRFPVGLCALLLMAGLVAQKSQGAAGFTNSGVSLPGLDYGSMAWGDYDRDGRLDAVLTGWGGSNYLTQLWRNTGSGFVNVNAGLTGVGNGTGVWGDYDNDGRLDLLLTGYTGDLAISQVWRNTGSGFTNIEAGLTGVYFSSGGWGDYDNDGRLDIALAGYAREMPAGPVTQIWRNTGTGFTNINAGITAVYNSAVDWGDYDNDGRLDLLVAGRTAMGIPLTEVWRNTGRGFSNINAGLTGVYRGSVGWRDYDLDGRLDLLLAGQTETSDTVEVWRNTGSSFSNSGVAIPGVRWASVTWGDYDNDRWADILVTGYRGTNTVGELWRNMGVGFVDSGIVLPHIYNSAVGWGDYNHDGRLDLLVEGYTKTNLLTQLLGNASPTENTAPTAPGNLAAVVTGTGVRLSWSVGTDAQTPVAGLTYNVRVGTASGGEDVLASQSRTFGLRMLPAPGNAGQRLFTVLTNLAPGAYYWSVQAVDTVMTGSAFAAEQSFVVGGPALSINNPQGRVVLQLRGNGSTSYTLQRSTNLTSWVQITTLNTGADGMVNWTNYAPTGWQMYRVRQP